MKNKIEKSFKELVELKYQLYKSLFLTLNFDAIEKAGNLLPILQKSCRSGLEQGKSPVEIIDSFFSSYRPGYSEKEKISFLFNVIQYVERQVVLVDALEEAAYKDIHLMGGASSWEAVTEQAARENKTDELDALLSEFGIRVVLTAHPTQFYPDRVLSIIKDLKDAISDNKISKIRDLLKQLGKTPFLNKEKPDPYNEALSLVSYLTKIFYPSVGRLLDRIGNSFDSAVMKNKHLISLGFWPGGDRDGNPFVTVGTTLKIADRLRNAALECYQKDIRKLKRRLSFRGVLERLEKLEELLYEELTNRKNHIRLSLDHFHRELVKIRDILKNDHQGLFLDKLDSFERKLNAFGFHMASIDIRQDSRVIRKTLEAVIAKHPELFPGDLFDMPEEEQINILLNTEGEISSDGFDDDVIIDTIESFKAIKQIQETNGEDGCHRYIISNCRGPLDVAVTFSLFRLCGWKDSPLTVDIVPLFETISDLELSGESMESLYSHPAYSKHLYARKSCQTVMLGFSDGTKDGGYLMANWAIYKAKEEISRVSRKNGVKVLFFDGRGGPPARGGGSTHLFYAAMGQAIESRQIQVTVQGQTINTQYGTIESAVHNLENLLTAGLRNNLFIREGQEMDDTRRALIGELADAGFIAYDKFKKDPHFMPYLNDRSTLKYFGKANIGSRPVKRGGDSAMNFEDLRAIPFVGAWSQLKQNVPGFFGVGSALEKMEAKGRLDNCRALYNDSLFFRALISNSMQSMAKTYFPLTSYMEKDERFGTFWKIIYDEFRISRDFVLKVTGSSELLEDNPRSRMSIRLRERIVLPLLVIQQYALMKLQELNSSKKPDEENIPVYEKMIIRTLFGNINAGRNSA